MKRAHIVLLGMALVTLLLAGGAASFFTDVAKSEDNEISSGKFDIAISKEGSRYYNDLKLFEFSGMKPGDRKTFEFYVKNRGDIAVSRLTMVIHVEDREKDITPAESEVDNTTDVGELSKYLVVKEMRVYKGNSSWVVNGVAGKTLRELNGSEVSLLPEPLREGETVRIAVTVEFSKNAGNECQTDISDVSVELRAEQ